MNRSNDPCLVEAEVGKKLFLLAMADESVGQTKPDQGYLKPTFTEEAFDLGTSATEIGRAHV